MTVQDTNDNAPSCQLTYSDTYLLAVNRTNRTIWLQEETEASASSALTLAYLTLTDADSAVSNAHALSATLLAVRYLNATSLLLQDESVNNSSSFRLVPIIAHYGNYYYALQLTSKLDRELTVHFDLTIRLSDNAASAGSESAMTTYVDVRVMLVDLNDNYPEFRPNTRVSSKQQDVVQFEYFKFAVVENDLALEFGTVEAFDADRVASARLEFKILDQNSPHLLDLYTEHVAKSDPIAAAGLAAALQDDDNLNPNYLFFIQPDNGTLGVRGELDRERRELYVFTVRVNDSQHVNDVLVEVRIVDVNDNQPVYQIERVEFALEENGGENRVVGNVRPSDPDEHAVTEYFIEPAHMAKYFYVEPLSGNLVAKTSLDAEDAVLAASVLSANHTFEMVIYARDPHFFNSTSSSSSSSSSSSISSNNGGLVVIPTPTIDLRQMSKLQVRIFTAKYFN